MSNIYHTQVNIFHALILVIDQQGWHSLHPSEMVFQVLLQVSLQHLITQSSRYALNSELGNSDVFEGSDSSISFLPPSWSCLNYTALVFEG